MGAGAWLLFGIVALTWGTVLQAADNRDAASHRFQVNHSPEAPRSGQEVLVEAVTPAKLHAGVLEYQVVRPGAYIARHDAAYTTHWTSVPMDASTVEGGGTRLSAAIPSAAQEHRSLVRYRIWARDDKEVLRQSPPSGDAESNHAYFIYDGMPGWKAAIDPKSWDSRKNELVEFPPDVMGQVQTYFVVARMKDVENATWYEQSQGKEYRHTGTFVADSKVYDHVPFRARGGVWRYAMGKNMWKFNFNKGHHLEARDDYGQRYRTKWGKLNLRACIQQADYGRRGEQGMYESVGFRLFNLAGVDAPHTHWISLRIVGEQEETPRNQYRGDFWGLYLAIENEDGDFLEEHELPDGNVYKMMFGRGELSHQGKGQPGDVSDLNRFLREIGRGGEEWWRSHVDLPRYYSYRSIVEAIHHYDIGDGKNYDFYFNPRIAKWAVIPWDIDLTWGDHMYGSGRDPFYSPVMRHAELKMEYQNRLREIRDLLYNVQETGRLIDECAAIIFRPGKLSIVDADRMKWDYHPVMDSGAAMEWKAGKGHFYEAVRSRDFSGMVAQMKEYVARRSAYIDRSLIADRSIPKTPQITNAGDPARLSFKSSPFSGEAGFAAMQWRLGQIDRSSSSGKPKERGRYEITAIWDSGELTTEQLEISVPPSAVQSGKVYRARVRMKDETGRWSHWSLPVEFTAR